MTHEIKSGNCYILQSRDDDQEYRPECFDVTYWRDKPGFEHLGGGRGGSCLIETGGDPAILRQYHRGGYVGNLLSNQYLWLGVKLARPWREWKVLMHAIDAGLPVPRPIAACVCRSGLVYRAALIMTYLADTEMLTQRLAREKLPADCWYRLGLLIKGMHEAGIRHADLTSDNVLIDTQNRFYLVDFDKARIMKRLDDWQWRPLYRFQRSINKRRRNRHLHYDEDDWQSFMDGYQS